MTYREAEGGGLFAETQGSFAPERLASRGAEPDVFSRRFTDGEHIIDVSAAPVIPDGREHGWEPDEYDVEVITEKRDVGDDGGDTSEYEYETITDQLLTYEQAVKVARAYIVGLDPTRDL